MKWEYFFISQRYVSNFIKKKKNEDIEKQISNWI